MTFQENKPIKAMFLFIIGFFLIAFTAWQTFHSQTNLAILVFLGVAGTASFMLGLAMLLGYEGEVGVRFEA